MSDLITDFFKKVDTHSQLIETKEETYELIHRSQNGDDEATNKLVESNLRLVISIAKRYRKISGVAFEDLIQEGTLGLFRAIEKFDTSMGSQFSTYASWWIRQNITRYISNHGRTVRIPIKMTEIYSKANRIRDDLAFELGREATDEEMAEALDISIERYRDILEAAQTKMSIDQPALRDSEQMLTIGETIEIDTPSIEDMIIKEEIDNSLMDALNILTEEEKYIILAVNGFLHDKYYPKKQIAKDLGYKSTSTITKRQRDAELKMKHYLMRNGVDGVESYMNE